MPSPRRSPTHESASPKPSAAEVEPAAVGALVDHLFRLRAGQMIATLSRIFGLDNLTIVEDVVQDALVTALRSWPWTGIPKNPSAWLVQVAKNRALDVLRRESRLRDKRDAIERDLASSSMLAATDDVAFSSELDDDQLRLIFACCHPALARDAQTALTLKTVSGFGVDEIAAAFLSKPATIAQRLTRARNKLKSAAIHLEVPPPAMLAERVDTVCEVIYLMFNEGYGACAGDQLVREDLCHEAARLATLLADHPLIGRPQVDALAALLLLQAARLPARVDADGEMVCLADQDRLRWDRRLLAAGLRRIESAARGSELSRYHLEAEIAAVHATATSWRATDWARIVACYETLGRLDASPVIVVNHAVALAELEGVDAALALLSGMTSPERLDGYYPLHAARADLLARANRREEAAACYDRALALSISNPARRFLERRRAALG